MSSESYSSKNWEQYTKEDKEEFLHHMYHSRSQPLTPETIAKTERDINRSGTKLIYFTPPLRLSQLPSFGYARAAPVTMAQSRDYAARSIVNDASNNTITKSQNGNSKSTGHSSSTH